MSFEAVAPSTNMLNGYSDAGEGAAIAQAKQDATDKANIAEAKKAVTAKVKSSKATKDDTPVAPLLQSQAPAPSATLVAVDVPTPKSPSENTTWGLYMVIVPIILWGVLIRWGYLRMLKWCANNKDGLQYGHLHKRHHPGRMKPRIFKTR
jgi:hypothetical protein